MITATARTSDGRTLLVLGLSDGNLERLRAGQPIRMTAETHKAIPADLVMLIFHGETEAAIEEYFRQHGLIDEQTRIERPS